MFIEDDNFLCLVENLEHYMAIDAVPITDNFIDPIDPFIHYPKISVDGLEICCLHYKTAEDAVTKWNERRKRINFDNIYVIGNSWNFHEDYDKVKRLLDAKYPTVVFTYKEYDDPRCIKLSGDIWTLDERSIIRPNITDFCPGTNHRYFEEQFDFVKWLNSQEATRPFQSLRK